MSPFFPIPIELVHKEFTKQMMAQLAIVHAVLEMNTHVMTQYSWVCSRLMVASR
jgi:hypothetical protein